MQMWWTTVGGGGIMCHSFKTIHILENFKIASFGNKFTETLPVQADRQIQSKSYIVPLSVCLSHRSKLPITLKWLEFSLLS